MMIGRVRHHALLTGLFLSAAASLVLAATNINAPAAGAMQALRKPAADAEALPRYIGAFETLLKEKYAALLTEPATGTPVVTVLFNRDGTIDQTDLESFPGSPEAFQASESQFERFGLSRDTVGYIGVQGVETRANTVLFVFSDRKDPTGPYTSRLFPDSQAIDRAIVERFFPNVLEGGVSAAEGIWVLFDRDGTVLRTGQERFDADQLKNLLESRYPGIKTSSMTVTPVMGADARPVKHASGQDLQLHSVWLAAGSAPPDA